MTARAFSLSELHHDISERVAQLAGTSPLDPNFRPTMVDMLRKQLALQRGLIERIEALERQA
jgi:hypothetical protein